MAQSSTQRPDGARACDLVRVGKDEALALLAEAPFGRIVFTRNALPAIRPVNHLVSEGRIIIRSHEGAAIVPAVAGDDGAVVAYQADSIDPESLVGWSVVVTGMAQLVRDPADIARYRTELQPWVSLTMDYVISIRPDIVTGFRLVARTDDPHLPSADAPTGGQPDVERTSS